MFTASFSGTSPGISVTTGTPASSGTHTIARNPSHPDEAVTDPRVTVVERAELELAVVRVDETEAVDTQTSSISSTTSCQPSSRRRDSRMRTRDTCPGTCRAAPGESRRRDARADLGERGAECRAGSGRVLEQQPSRTRIAAGEFERTNHGRTDPPAAASGRRRDVADMGHHSCGAQHRPAYEFVGQRCDRLLVQLGVRVDRLIRYAVCVNTGPKSRCSRSATNCSATSGLIADRATAGGSWRRSARTRIPRSGRSRVHCRIRQRPRHARRRSSRSFREIVLRGSQRSRDDCTSRRYTHA